MLYSIARHRFPVPLFGFHFDKSYSRNFEELFYEFKFLVYFFNSMYQYKISHIFQNLIECRYSIKVCRQDVKTNKIYMFIKYIPIEIVIKVRKKIKRLKNFTCIFFMN